MKCPTDGSILTMSERNGIEIDYCPTCRGVWLDRGELDKIIERSESMQQPAAPAAQAPAPAYDRYEDRRDDRRDHQRDESRDHDPPPADPASFHAIELDEDRVPCGAHQRIGTSSWTSSGAA